MFTLPVNHLKFSDPRTISGCQCWLRSDLGITLATGTVSNWANLVSGVTGNAAQATVAKAPAYNANRLNGRPGLTFNGTQGMQWALNLQGAKTVVVVVKQALNPPASTIYSIYSVKGSTGPVYSEYAPLNLGGYQNQSFMDDVGGISANSTGYSDLLGTTGHISVLTYNGGGNTVNANYTARLDGTLKTLVASGAFARVLTDLGAIGARIDSGNNCVSGFNGDIFEVIVYNRVLTAAEQALLYGYLKTLYGL